jgi:predicted transcriptional regulator YdeE
MDKLFLGLSEILLVGIKASTNNALEMNPQSAKIGITMQKFFAENLVAKIKNIKSPSKTFSVYTDYESDFTGDYTYFIGKEVTSLDQVDEGLEVLIIPAQQYAKFTNSQPGPIAKVALDMWQTIWKMDVSDLGGKRAYIADFELYDERSFDFQNAVLDIYIGLENKD